MLAGKRQYYEWQAKCYHSHIRQAIYVRLNSSCFYFLFSLVANAENNNITLVCGILRKDAVCIFIFLTVLKHKNTTTCLQIFNKKHANITYLFLRKTTLLGVILILSACYVSECLFLFWSVWLHPLTVYPIGFQHASCQKTQHIVRWTSSAQHNEISTTQRYLHNTTKSPQHNT